MAKKNSCGFIKRNGVTYEVHLEGGRVLLTQPGNPAFGVDNFGLATAKNCKEALEQAEKMLDGKGEIEK